MANLFKLAARNLLRYRRRTGLTALLITIGMLAVLLFLALSGAFKQMMVGQITDSMLGHLQIHRTGYVASLDNLPLNLMMSPAAVSRAEQQLSTMAEVEAWSPRVKFGAMFSNFTETTNIRLNAVYPEQELATAPLLAERFVAGGGDGGLLSPGEILIPQLLARGMNVQVGDTVVLVATNQDGAVNGQTFVVRGVLEGITGPGGRDGYMHLEDAVELLRMEERAISEFAVRLNDTARLDQAMATLQSSLGELTNPQGRPLFEIHDWRRLTPFANIANMIDLMTLFIQIMLVAIVLISIMNVMIMAVYERMREIGTLAAIGTPPHRILALFVTEGLLLGAVGAAIGTVLTLGMVALLRLFPVTFAFGRQEGLALIPSLAISDVLFVAALVIVVSVLAALQPAWKAARMAPITALRAV